MGLPEEQRRQRRCCRRLAAAEPQQRLPLPLALFQGPPLQQGRPAALPPPSQTMP